MTNNGLDLRRWTEVRFEVLRRDRYKCTEKQCNYKEPKGVPQGKSKLTVHHIIPKVDLKLECGKYAEDAYNKENLITLCNKCHKLEHKTIRRSSTNILYNRKLRHRFQKQYKPSKRIVLTMLEIVTLFHWLYGYNT